MKNKRIKAEEWFLEAKDHHDKLKDEGLNLIGVDKSWVEQQKNPGKALHDLVESKKLNKNTKDKIVTIFEYADVVNEHAWNKFRYENIDNEFGLTRHLFYDKETKEIVIQEDPLQFVGKMIKKSLTDISKAMGLDPKETLDKYEEFKRDKNLH